jgi:hypothetical protein
MMNWAMLEVQRIWHGITETRILLPWTVHAEEGKMIINKLHNVVEDGN